MQVRDLSSGCGFGIKWLGVALIALGVGLAPTAQGQAPGVQRDLDVRYYEGAGYSPVKHRLDVYRPSGASRAPVILFVHGGSWQSGDKSFYDFIGERFAAQGFVTVVINYRLTPAVRHPEHVRDVARAFRWTYEHVHAYGGDPRSIYLAGHSAGGHLVALLALNERFLEAEGMRTNMIRGVIGVSGVYVIEPDARLFDDVFSADPAARLDASPLEHVDARQPPFLLAYGRFDFPTLDDQAEALAEALVSQGTPARAEEIGGRGHYSIVLNLGKSGDPTTQLIESFVNEDL